jgi:aspartate beta-hydroxylase
MSTKFAILLKSAILKTNTVKRPSPSIFFFAGLNSRPIHNRNNFNFSNILEKNYEVILNEYLNLKSNHIKSDYSLHGEKKLHTGIWDWNSYVMKGKRQSNFALLCPKTVDILESISNPSLMVNTPFSYAFFSTLHGNSTIAAHYGPCNLRLRCHFPLIVPLGDCGMEVGNETIKWEKGIPIIFDDCYEHKGKSWNLNVLLYFYLFSFPSSFFV